MGGIEASRLQPGVPLSGENSRHPKAEPGPAVLLHCHAYAIKLWASMRVSAEPAQNVQALGKQQVDTNTGLQ